MSLTNDSVQSEATAGAAVKSERQQEKPQPRKSQPAQRPASSKWSWTVINFWVDTLLLVVFVALVWVATVVQFVFPPASTATAWLLWGWNVDQWMGVEYALLALFTFGVLVHLMLHWSWVCGVFFTRVWPSKKPAKVPDDGTRTIYGVGLMIVMLNLLGLLLAAAALGIRPPV